jgi:hypothetical protein
MNFFIISHLIKYYVISKTYLRLFENIEKINWVALIMSVSAILTILVFKMQINDRFSKKFGNIPFPIELLVVS